MRRQATIASLLAALVCAACGGVPKTYYYTLENPSAPPPQDPKTSFVLGIETFRAPELLRDDRIVYYESPTQLNYYDHHRWAAYPSEMLSELAARWLDQSGAFAEVRLQPTREATDYELKGRVLNFEEFDRGPAGVGRAGLELTLVRSKDHKVVWSGRRETEAPIQEKGVPGLVAALNTASRELLNELLPGLVERVEADYHSASTQNPK